MEQGPRGACGRQPAVACEATPVRAGSGPELHPGAPHGFATTMSCLRSCFSFWGRLCQHKTKGALCGSSEAGTLAGGLGPMHHLT